MNRRHVLWALLAGAPALLGASFAAVQAGAPAAGAATCCEPDCCPPGCCEGSAAAKQQEAAAACCEPDCCSAAK